MRSDPLPALDHTSAYDTRPWLSQYPSDVPASLAYPPLTLWELLERTASAYPDRPALVFQNDGMSYRSLHRASLRMSQALSVAGVGKGDVVMLLLPNVPHFPVTYYGAMRLGAIVAAAPPNSVDREIEHLLSDSGARVVVTLDLLYDRIEPVWRRHNVTTMVVGTAVDFMPIWKRTAGRATGKVPKPKHRVNFGSGMHSMRQFLRRGRPVAPAGISAEDVALLQYTGGTTGVPKAAMLTHRNLVANAYQMRAWFPRLRDGEETILAVLPFFHVYGVTLVMNAGLLLAARTVLVPRPAPLEMFAAIRLYRPTIFPGVPTLYISIVGDRRSRQYDLSSIDVCVSGGAPLPVEVKREFESITGGHLYEGYGLSEASPVSHAEPHDGRSRAGSMGLPLPDTEARVVDAGGRPVPVGEDGELIIRGPQVMPGYWHRPEETAAVLRDGWLWTGDMARMDADGWFSIVDRKKDIIITGGENIYPREVEEVLFEHPAVLDVAVVGVPHPYGGEIAKAFVVLRAGQPATKKDIIQFAAQRLAKHKVPRAVEFRPELPKSGAQKVLRRVLSEQERERQAQRGARRGRIGPSEET